MSSSQQHHHTTSMFARVVGPYLVIIAITAALRPVDMKTLLSQFEANSLWAWVVGAFILLLGLVTIALHPYWRGAAAIIVSVLGWLVALKGLMLVAFPHTYFSIANSAIDAVGWWRGGAVVYGSDRAVSELTSAGCLSGPARRRKRRAQHTTSRVPPKSSTKTC